MPLILFDVAKREQFAPTAGYKKLARRLRASYDVQTNKDDLDTERLVEARPSCLVLAAPREKFSQHEVSGRKEGRRLPDSVRA